MFRDTFSACCLCEVTWGFHLGVTTPHVDLASVVLQYALVNTRENLSCAGMYLSTFQSLFHSMNLRLWFVIVLT